jgi:hypothetical protein
MKYLDLKQCLSITDEVCASYKINIEEVEFSLINFQRGVNAPLEQKARITFDFSGNEISVEVTPKKE